MQFGLVRLTFKIKYESDQIKLMRFDLDRYVRFFRDNTIFFQQ